MFLKLCAACVVLVLLVAGFEGRQDHRPVVRKFQDHSAVDNIKEQATNVGSPNESVVRRVAVSSTGGNELLATNQEFGEASPPSLLARNHARAMVRFTPLSGKEIRGLTIAGNATNQRNDTRIFALLSFCADVRGLLQKMVQLNDIKHNIAVVRVVVISKCGRPIPPASDDQKLKFEIVHLPNVGRCDHSYAWALRDLAQVFGTTPRDQDIIYFGKDNNKVHQPGFRNREDFHEFVADAYQSGFACQYISRDLHVVAPIHRVADLSKWEVMSYRAGNDPKFRAPRSLRGVGRWWEVIGATAWIPSDFVRVCYGGNFAFRGGQLRAIPREVFKKMTVSLERGDNIEEGHYAERSWAALLGRNVSALELESLGICKRMFFYPGMMCSTVGAAKARG